MVGQDDSTVPSWERRNRSHCKGGVVVEMGWGRLWSRCGSATSFFAPQKVPGREAGRPPGVQIRLPSLKYTSCKVSLWAWQRHGEARSPLRFAVNRNCALVSAGDGDGDGKTKACATDWRAVGGRSVLTAVEAIENVGQVFGRDALPSINYLDERILVPFVKTQDDRAAGA